MSILEDIVKSNFDWSVAIVITVPFILAATNEIVNDKSTLNHIREGMDRARVLPVEERPLTNEEVFAYQL